MVKVPPKHPLPETAEIRAIKADAINIARTQLEPKHAPGFEQYVDEMLAIEHHRSGEIPANKNCNSCFGRGRVRKMKTPGVKPAPGTKEELTIHPCDCVLKTYYKRKPSNEVIIPAGEYCKPVEPPATVQKSETKSRRKKQIPDGGAGATEEPKTPKRVRKTKSSISGTDKN